jgi:hypothetical protein
MTMFGYKLRQPAPEGKSSEVEKDGVMTMPNGRGGMMAKIGRGNGKGKGGMMPMMPMMMGKEASPIEQLAALVTKLDQLTHGPLKLDLTKEQRKELRAQVSDVLKAKTMTDETAKERLDAMLKVLERQKEVLTAAGYRWPGPPGGAPAADDNKTMHEHMAELEKTLNEQSK